MSGFLLILFSELGDKTFFIALLLALKQSQALVFAGTFGALAVMTVVSVGACRSWPPSRSIQALHAHVERIAVTCGQLLHVCLSGSHCSFQ